MKRTLLITAAFLLLLLPASGRAQGRGAVDVTGQWAMALDMSMGQSEPMVDLKQDGTKLTGTYTGRYGAFPLTGTLNGRHVEFVFTMNPDNEPVAMSFSGDVGSDGETMKGEATLGPLGEAEWTAKRIKEKK